MNHKSPNPPPARKPAARKVRALCVLLLAGLCASIAGPAPSARAAEIELLASVEGTVLDSLTGEAIPGAEVSLLERGLTTATNSSGRFAWRDLSMQGEIETVTITVTAQGYGGWRLENASLIALDTLILNVEMGAEPVTIAMPEPRQEAPGAYREEMMGDIADLPEADLADLTIPETITVRVYGPPYSPCIPDRTGYTTEVLDFKYYVKHVLPNEWVRSWPGESLRAGAMAAKMYGWYWVVYPGSWDVRDDVCDQVYNPAVEYASTNRAVDFTWNWRITRNDNLLSSLHYLDWVWRCNEYNWSDCIGQYDTYYHALGNNGYDKLTWDEMLFRYYGPIDITAVVPPPEFGYMLRFHGNGTDDEDRLKVLVEPHVPIDVGMDFTIEWWMKADLADNTTAACSTGAHENWRLGNIIFDRDIANAAQPDYGISLAGGRIAVGVSNGSSVFTMCGTRVVADSAWHHIALTRDGATGELRLYIDGSFDTAAAGPAGDIQFPDGLASATANDKFLVIGANKYSLTDDDYFPAYDGFMDEIRFSNLIRYSAPFPHPIHPFTTDGGTVALFHFDEGYGDTLHDTSGAPGGPSDAERFYGGGTNGPEWHTSDLEPMYELYFPLIIR
jgi:hypothetical protein